MSLKKKLGMGAASAALGLTLIGGGTYAFFSDSVETSANFQAGTLDLNANPTTIIDVKDIKPGDTMTRSFELVNGGSLDIAEILLKTDYTVTDAKGDNTVEDFGEHIKVNFLYNWDKTEGVIWSTTLADLKNMTPDALKNEIFIPWLDEKGGNLEAGTSDELFVQYEFVENDQDQNVFQGDKLELKWTFEGKQGAGEEK
ncbi:CalY family protein [Bacillus massilinigeriensis]|uniref:CalY family protein n=1 Tax=Bacillus mediterraneensis TaxID=1805474 RepID=UPI0008F949BA|nr:CalY family protein [Bacillus mediterraneensis]